jgi:hypothetical protein
MDRPDVTCPTKPATLEALETATPQATLRSSLALTFFGAATVGTQREPLAHNRRNRVEARGVASVRFASHRLSRGWSRCRRLASRRTRSKSDRRSPGRLYGRRRPSVTRGWQSLDLNSPARVRRRAERRIVICFAGPHAQRSHRPSSWRSWHGSDDHAIAGDLALRMFRCERSAAAHLKHLEDHSRELIASSWASVEMVAEALFEQGTLNRGALSAILQSRTQTNAVQRSTRCAWNRRVTNGEDDQEGSRE